MAMGSAGNLETRLRELLAASRRVSSSRDRGEMYVRLAEAARNLLGAVRVTLHVPDPATGLLRLVPGAVAGPPAPAEDLSRLDRRAEEASRDAAQVCLRVGPDGKAGWAALNLRIGEENHGVLLLEIEEDLAVEDRLLLDALGQCSTLWIRQEGIQEEMRIERDKVRNLLDSLVDAVIATDERGRVTYFGTGAEDILGFRAEEVLGRGVVDFYDGGLEEARKVMGQLRSRGKVVNLELCFRGRGGRTVPVNLSAAMLRSQGGQVTGTVGVLKEISRQKELEARLERTIQLLQHANEQLERLATTDSLSGLANHRMFYQSLDAEIERSHRTRRPMSVLLLDIDRFKAFNDTHGHLVGDHVIEEIGRVIRGAIRKIDLGCRYGGEEFTVILPETGADDACVAAMRIMEGLSRAPLFARLGIRSATLSVGVAEYRPRVPRPSPAELVRKADEAMYAAKREGGNRISRFAEGEDSSRAGDAFLEEEPPAIR